MKNHLLAAQGLCAVCLQAVKRDVLRLGDVLEGVFVGIADVDQNRAFGDQRARLFGGNTGQGHGGGGSGYGAENFFQRHQDAGDIRVGHAVIQGLRFAPEGHQPFFAHLRQMLRERGLA